MTQTSDPYTDAWQAIFRVQTRARRHVETALRSGGLPGLDLCSMLNTIASPAEADAPLTARKIEARLDLPQYHVSRCLDRLERDGLVARRPHPTDRRSTLVTLTETGAQTAQKARQTEEHAIKAFFDGHLRPGQLDRLAMLLAPLTEPSEADP